MYPVWEVPYLTSGLIIAIIATFHILPSHLSTGALWITAYVETVSIRRNWPELMEFVKKFALLLLVFAYVFGSLSGVGIWFATTVANPRGISALIHNYVWGWATEWVFFIIEVSAIFIYYYTLDKISPRLHVKIGWIFAIASWITMVIITGILAFMLSPGRWPESGNFFQGFFNETYPGQLLTRTAFMFAISGLYALAVASTMKNESAKEWVKKVASRFGIAGVVLGVIFAFVYLKSLPQDAKELLGEPAVVSGALKLWTVIPVVITAAYFVVSMFTSKHLKLPVAVAMIIVFFVSIWNAERIRESIRKPFVVPHYMYSNQVIGYSLPAKGVEAEHPVLVKSGLLKLHPFVPEQLKNPDDEKLFEAGRLVALYMCSSCHSLSDGGIRPLPRLVRNLEIESVDEMMSFIEDIGDFSYMPPFSGNEIDKKALAVYLIETSKKSSKEE